MKELVRKSAFVILWGVVALPVTVACIALALWDGHRARRMRPTETGG